MPPGHGVHRHMCLSLLLLLWQGGRGVVADGLREGLQRRMQAPVASARNLNRHMSCVASDARAAGQCEETEMEARWATRERHR